MLQLTVSTFVRTADKAQGGVVFGQSVVEAPLIYELMHNPLRQRKASIIAKFPEGIAPTPQIRAA